jgi:serine/threonine-protein kinase RsbW
VAHATETRTLAINAREVAALDDWIEMVGERWDLSQRTVLRARLCVAELATNVIEHAAPRSSDRISVTLRWLDDGIGVEIVDTCAPFDPTEFVAAPMPDRIADVPPGGRGLTLLRSFSRKLSYRNSDGRNHVSIEIAAA